MSHTTKINDTIWVHNGCYDGDIIIQRGPVVMQIPFDDLKGIVAEYIRMKKISELENMSYEELLK